MCIIKRYNGKVLTVNGLYALKCIGTHLYHPIVLDTNHWEKTEIPHSQLGISVLPTSPKQGIIHTVCSLVAVIAVSFMKCFVICLGCLSGKMTRRSLINSRKACQRRKLIVSIVDI